MIFTKRKYILILVVIALLLMAVILTGCNKPETYTVTFNANGGTGAMLSQIFTEKTVQTLNPNEFISEGYSFIGWSTSTGGSVQYTDKSSYTATADITLYAVWEKNTLEKIYFTVTFKVDNVQYGEIQNIENGHPAAAPVNPIKMATEQYEYTFTGWDKAFDNITENIVINAQFNSTIRGYTIVFQNYDDTLLQSTSVEYGIMPEYIGAIPTKASTVEFNYTFSGWSPAVTEVIGAVIYTATFNSTVRTYPAPVITYTITWNVEGTTSTISVSSGAMPSYGSTTPTKASTSEFDYTFRGWSPAITAATANAAYTAQFNSVTRNYTITWDIEGVTSTTSVAYGATPSYGSIPAKSGTANYYYEFDCWSPDIATVTGAATYTAQFNPVSKGLERLNPITIQLSTSITAVINGSEEKYDDKNGKWYCFTPRVTGIYVIKATENISKCCIYLFDSTNNSEMASNDGEGFLDRFRLEYELTADITYYFFVAFDFINNGEITFEIFNLYSVTELIQIINTAEGKGYVKAVIELIDLAQHNSDAEAVLEVLDVTILKLLADSGDYESIYVLMELVLFGNSDSFTALSNINITALKILAEGGLFQALDLISGIACYGNFDAIEALEKLDITGFLILAEGGDLNAIEVLLLLSNCGNVDAIAAIPHIITLFIYSAENGDINAVDALIFLADNFNTDAAAALQILNVTAFKNLAESGDFDSINMLWDLYGYCGNTNAEAALSSLDTTAFITLANEGNYDVVIMLLDLVNYFGNTNAKTALQTIDTTEFILLAANGNIDMLRALIILADFGNTGAEAALKNFDATEFIPLAESGDIDAVWLLMELARYGNLNVQNALANLNTTALITLARGGSFQAVDMLIFLKSYGNTNVEPFIPEIVTALIPIAESGDLNAINAVFLLSYTGNSEAIAAIPGIMAALKNNAGNGDLNAITAILFLADRGNSDAINAIPGIVTALINSAESGDFDAVDNLLFIFYSGYSTVITDLETLNIEAFVDLYESGDDRALNVLIILAGLGNTAAQDYLDSLS